jgi:PAS domain-containing protein
VQLFEQAPVGYLAADGAGVLREINAEGARLLGVALEDCPGRPLDSFLVPDSGRLLRAMLDRIGAGARRDGCRLQVVPITGALRVIDAHGSADAVRGGFLVALVPGA